MKRRLIRSLVVAVLIVALAAVAYPRFDRQDIGIISKYTGKIEGEQSLGDAAYYISYVKYFRGDGLIENVQLPFRYRPLIPYLASLLPVDSAMTSINIINLAALYLTIAILFVMLKRLDFEFGYAIAGCFLYAVSFPVFYMSTTGYLEASAMVFLVAGTCLIYRKNWIATALVIAGGVFVKETVAILVPVGFVYLWACKTRWRNIIGVTILLGASFVIPTAVIRSVFRDAGDFYWIPNIPTLLFNLRLRALASLGLTFGIPGILTLLFLILYRRYSIRVEPNFLLPSLAGLACTLLLVFYSMLTAYTDGRFIWPAAVFTIPIALWFVKLSIRDRRAKTN